MSSKAYVEKILDTLKEMSPGQDEFYQAAEEVLMSLIPLLDEDSRYEDHNILERIVIPERSIIFRVTWIDENTDKLWLQNPV